MARYPSDAARLIAQLKARKTPWSNAAIGRALGINSSYISQVMSGAKRPTTAITGAFRALSRTRKAPPAPSETTPRIEHAGRTTAEGTPATVRKPATTYLEKKTTRDGRIVDDKDGNILYETKRGWKTLMKNLQRAAEQGKGVSLTITFATLESYGQRTGLRNAEVNLFTHAGWNASRVVDRLNALGYADNPTAALTQLTYEMVLGVEGAGKITNVVMQTYSRAQ